MSRLDDWDDPLSTFVLLAIIFGFSALIVLAETIPLMAALVVFGLGLGGLWWMSIHSTASDGEAEATRDRDPLAVLKERYAHGDISEEQFEHRVTMILDVDEIADREQEAEHVIERE